MEQTSLFPRYADAIRNLNLAAIRDAGSIPDTLLLGRDGSVSTYYIPFDWVNPGARVVLVGITPGFTQFMNAVREAQRQLRAGAETATALREAKHTGAFSGAMRPNLVALLDYFRLNRWLGIGSCDELFGRSAHFVQTTSALRYPVFVDGKNYNGRPVMTKHPLLRRMLREHFVPEAQALNDAVFIPLGPKVSEALSWLAAEGVIDERRVLDGIPHPSGANAERILYMLQRKPRAWLSAKTDPIRLDAARDALRSKVDALLRRTV